MLNSVFLEQELTSGDTSVYLYAWFVNNLNDWKSIFVVI